MNVKKGILIVAIALILAFFVGYGIEVFDPTPNYDQFYRDMQLIDTEEECTAAEGNWVKDRYAPKPVGEEAIGYCEPPYEKLEQQMSMHDKVVFIVAVVIGILSVVGGLVLNKETISTGIISGGVLLILYGTIRYWRYANNVLKFVLLGIVLAILIFLAYKKLDQK